MEESSDKAFIPMTTPESLKGALVIVATTPEDALKITNTRRALRNLEPIEDEMGLKLFKDVSVEHPRIDISNDISSAERRAFEALEQSETLGIKWPSVEICGLKRHVGEIDENKKPEKLKDALNPEIFRQTLKKWRGPQLEGI